MSEITNQQLEEIPVIFDMEPCKPFTFDAVADEAHRKGYCYFCLQNELDASGQPILFKLTDTEGEYEVTQYPAAA